MNCHIRYLKNVGKLDENYQEFTNGNANATDVNCDEIVKKRKNKIRAKMFSKTSTKPEDVEITTCMNSEFQSHHFEDIDIRRMLFVASETLTQDEKNIKMDEMSQESGELLLQAIVNCKAEEPFIEHMLENVFYRAKFDSMFKSDILLSNYCMRKFVVDNGFIDTNIYNVTLNTANLNVTDVNCDEILKNYDANLKDKKDVFNDGFLNCIASKAEGIIDRGVFWKFYVLVSSNISEDNKKSEVQNYIKIFKQINFSNLFGCLSKQLL